MKPAYSVIPRLLTPDVNPGDIIEIELFISGYGKIDKNKLQVSYPQSLINKNNPGYAEYCIKAAHDKNTGVFQQPVAGPKYKDKYEFGKDGFFVAINEGFFSDIPGRTYPENAVPNIMSENVFSDIPPFLFKMNTSCDVPKGDYDVTFVLTYYDGVDYYIDSQKVEVHVLGWVERNQKILQIIGIVLGLIAIIAEIIQTYYSYLQLPGVLTARAI